jgi:pimeloyl-ACP methyl ester carboxylesterase
MLKHFGLKSVALASIAYVVFHHFRGAFNKKKSVKVDSGTVNFELKMPENYGSYPIVVLLCGMGAPAVTWRAIQNMLHQKGIASLSFDHSALPSIKSFAKELHEVIDAVLPEHHPIVLVGHSFGGVTAQYFVQNYPTTRIVSLVLVEPTPCKEFLQDQKSLLKLVDRVTVGNDFIAVLADCALIRLFSDLSLAFLLPWKYLFPTSFPQYSCIDLIHMGNELSQGTFFRRTSMELRKFGEMLSEGMNMEMNWRINTEIRNRVMIVGSCTNPQVEAEILQNYHGNTVKRIQATDYLIDSCESHASLIYSKILLQTILNCSTANKA